LAMVLLTLANSSKVPNYRLLMSHIAFYSGSQYLD
jgi:hypothetical protein